MRRIGLSIIGCERIVKNGAKGGGGKGKFTFNNAVGKGRGLEKKSSGA